MLVTASHQLDQDVFVSFDKEALKQIASVAAHPLFSNEANWVMVSIVFKHNASIKRLVSGFKNDFTKTDNVKVQPDMVGGEVYELHEILISGTDREPILSIDRSEIANAASMDLTLADGNADVVLSSSSGNSVYAAFSVTATFSKSVTGLSLADITVVNGTASSLSGSGAVYTFSVTPSGSTVSVQIDSGKVNEGNNPSNQLTRTYVSPTGWVGANNGVWSTASNWNPQVVPNSTTAFADISRSISGTGVATLLVDSDVTVNNLKFSAATTQWTLSNSNAKSLTLGGTSPTLESSQGSTFIQSPTIIDGDLTIKGSSNYYFGYNSSSLGKVTANNKNIVIDPTVQSVTFNYNNLGTFVGGTLTFSKVLLANINSYNSQFGGVNGPKIVYKNDSLSPIYGSTTNSGALRSATSIPNAIEFQDVGSYNFKVNALMTGTLTGSISKTLYVENVQGGAGMTGNISGLSFTGNGKIVVKKGTDALFTNSAINGGEISLCDSTDSNTLDVASFTIARYGSTGTISHNLKARGSCTNMLYLTSGSQFNGSIVMNPEGSAVNGSIFNIGSNGVVTINGVISDGGANTQNMKFQAKNGQVKLTAQNTYSSPTSVEGLGLEVSGALLNSNVTITANGAFYLTGSCKSVTNNGTLYGFYFSPISSNSSTTVGTINGDFINSGKLNPSFGAGNASTKLIVNGNVTLGGTISYTGPGPVSGNSYVIMEYTGTRTGTFATNNLGAGTSITYDDANKRVIVTKT
jgi:hypothetical protein